MKSQRRLPAVEAAALLVAVSARRVEAQVTTGWMAGTVRDTSAGVLPGATITVRGPALQRASLTATVTEDGTYRVALVPPGVYQVTVELDGFKPQTRENVLVALNRQTTLDFALAVAGLAEWVQVTAEAPLVEVSRSDINAEVSNRTIEALPLNGRNYEAEFGRAQGGVANIITRSGTNDPSGRAFWFMRNDRLDSSNVANQAPPKLNRDQWGGTLGGPVKRDKGYVFGSFEKLNETRGTNFDLSAIPAFVAGGLATPGGIENFGIGPETSGFTGFGKAFHLFNRANVAMAARSPARSSAPPATFLPGREVQIGLRYLFGR